MASWYSSAVRIRCQFGHNVYGVKFEFNNLLLYMRHYSEQWWSFSLFPRSKIRDRWDCGNCLSQCCYLLLFSLLAYIHISLIFFHDRFVNITITFILLLVSWQNNIIFSKKLLFDIINIYTPYYIDLNHSEFNNMSL